FSARIVELWRNKVTKIRRDRRDDSANDALVPLLRVINKALWVRTIGRVRIGNSSLCISRIGPAIAYSDPKTFLLVSVRSSPRISCTKSLTRRCPLGAPERDSEASAAHVVSPTPRESVCRE